MNEIEKLYENAGVKKIFKYYECSYGTSSIQVCPIPLGDCIGVCDRKSIWEYPSFTAEKQIELIKWLCKETYRNYLLIRYNFTNYYWQIECNMTDSDKLDHFAETIASMINNLWQDLTEEEKQQVKEILE